MPRGIRKPASRRMTAPPVTGVVLAAGASRRLGTPKQVLPYRDTTLLGATLDVARSAGFDQLVVTLGASAQTVREAVRLDGVDVVTVDDPGAGCSASLRAALERVDPRAAGIVLILGDQPCVDPAAMRRLATEGPGADIMVCHYDDGVGHPFWLSRSVFGEVSQLHGDKGIWKLVESGRHPVRELAIDGPIPLDVDTWEDYQRLVGSS
jgi:molybdenum cofactor cytidylyltransferase